MIFPKLNELPVSRSVTEEFLGYNHNLRIGGGEFYDMKNLTSSYYPVLSPRSKRGVYAEPYSPQGLIAKDNLCYVDNGKLYIDKSEVVGLELTVSPKQLISMGAYIIIMPDKKWVNTTDLTYGAIEASFNPEEEVISAKYEMCKVDGELYTNTIQSNTPPDPDAENGTYPLWIDISTSPHALKQYSTSNDVWSQIGTTYIKISAPNIASEFKQYDAVKITGLPSDMYSAKDLEGKVSPLWEAYHDPNGGEGDYIVVVGFIDYAIPARETNLKLERTMPKMDFIIESGNRLWGCRYGLNADNEVVNEIYASKLGDFKNWFCYMGLSTDSYAASCGTDGQWTGAITHLGYPLFFKENFLHKVYGNFPANFQIQSTACRGVERGSGNSLAIVNEVLYYKGRSGVCAYDGSLPGEISYQFGEERYSEAVGGSHGNKYYISMKDNKGAYNLFVYDTAKGLWHKEDEVNALCFCSCRDELYYIDRTDKKIKTILGSGAEGEGPIEWMAETGIIGTSSPDKKYVSRLNIRMALDKGAKVTFYAQYDSFGEWHHISSMVGTSLRTFTVPVRPRRCDHFRLRIVGTGDGKIYSIAKTIEEGSDI